MIKSVKSVKIIKKEVTHQGIGGKEFIVDEAITDTLNPTEIWRQCEMGNMACLNFIMRREDFDPTDDKDLSFPHKLYYGKVDGIGYIIAADEIETIDINNIKPVDIKHPSTDGLPSSGGVGGACASIMASKDIVGKDLINNINNSINKNFISGGRQ